MTDELVKRLRGDWFGYEVSLKAIDAMEEAADRIEQLTAERDRAEDELYELQQTCITLRGENETLTAERDRLRALPAVQPHVNETPKSEHVPGVMLTPATGDA